MELNVEEIMEILPHRYPMLLVDKIIEMVPMKYAIGVKCVTMNEPFVQGHFPGHPVMPGALICEAMAQVGGVALQYPEENFMQSGNEICKYFFKQSTNTESNG